MVCVIEIATLRKKQAGEGVGVGKGENSAENSALVVHVLLPHSVASSLPAPILPLLSMSIN